MIEIKQSKIFTIELTEVEVELIHALIQGSPKGATNKVCLGLFVGTGRLLGKKLEDDGSLTPQTKS